MGAATVWERRSCGSGDLAANDAAPAPWDVRGRVAAPTPGSRALGPPSTAGAATLWERRPRRERRCPGALGTFAAGWPLPRSPGHECPGGELMTRRIASSQPAMDFRRWSAGSCGSSRFSQRQRRTMLSREG